MMRYETSATKGRGLRRDKAVISRVVELVGWDSGRSPVVVAFPVHPNLPLSVQIRSG